MEASSKENLQLISVVPNKMVWNAKETIALIFNNKLPSSREGSFHVEFRGRNREVMQVKAQKMNQMVLTVTAPEYFPAEMVKIHVRHMTRDGFTSLGSHEFLFMSRDYMMSCLLHDITDPVAFMCESLGISPSDMNALDKALTASFKANIPPGFHLLGLRNADVENAEKSDSRYPTLLHFAAAFGLHHFVKDCLRHCPGCFEAVMLQNCNGERPSNLAYKGQFMDIYEVLSYIESTGGEALYEPMNESNEDNPYYAEVSRQGYINLQLWRHSSDCSDAYVDAQPDHHEDYYTNMTRGYEASQTEAGQDQIYTDMSSGNEQLTTDEDGYIDTQRPHVVNEEIYTDMESGFEQLTTDDNGYIDTQQSQVVNEEIYADMESGVEQSDFDGYVRTPEMHPDGEELYADMEGNHGDLYVDVSRKKREEICYNEQSYHSQGQASSHYQIPSNLPVCDMYPDQRSISVSVNRRSDFRQPKPQPAAPSIPPRKSDQAALKPPVTPLRPASIASGNSAISQDSGYGEQDENLFEDPQEIRRYIEDKNEPPPLPQTDYHSRPVSPKPKATRNHERSKTLPVSTADVNSARLGQTGRTTSLKERPAVSNRPSSDLQAVYRPPATPPTVNRRGSDVNITSQRPPAPSPGPSSSRQGIPSPFVLAMQEKQEPPPPAPPPRVTSRQPLPTPAPRGQRKY